MIVARACLAPTVAVRFSNYRQRPGRTRFPRPYRGACWQGIVMMVFKMVQPGRFVRLEAEMPAGIAGISLGVLRSALTTVGAELPKTLTPETPQV